MVSISIEIQIILNYSFIFVLYVYIDNELNKWTIETLYFPVNCNILAQYFVSTSTTIYKCIRLWSNRWHYLKWYYSIIIGHINWHIVWCFISISLSNSILIKCSLIRSNCNWSVILHVTIICSYIQNSWSNIHHVVFVWDWHECLIDQSSS